jgi:hypothetical protein
MGELRDQSIHSWRASRALDCFIAIGEQSDAVLSNGDVSQ